MALGSGLGPVYRVLMVRLNRIYTRTGDDGSTGLADGSRRPKDDLRLASYGCVDELNACVGSAAAAARQAGPEGALAPLLERLQHDLFDLGADLATPGDRQGLRITAEQVLWIEARIDAFNADLPALESFVLPGGSELACRLHLARTVCRRAERLTVELARREKVGPQVLPFLNRLSDLLFVLARVANDGGEGDVLWVPGRNRG